ncbi:DUF3006 domain-containing protein [Clostridium sp. 1001271B_151109_B4]|uniref:DUF3006 domain-containing protein n=1 Tax=Clostridium sp. 1001271B_151109_B4 TaxID=2787148 RepID=UPI0018A8A16F|nr:DUF3006 domain-containing protein [Clostridium sp. 1001271B_151109_B4]
MEKKKFIVDRIEENSVVLEDEKQGIILIDINLFDTRPSEGDVIIKIDDTSFKVNEEATKKRKSNINALMKGMWKE